MMSTMPANTVRPTKYAQIIVRHLLCISVVYFIQAIQEYSTSIGQIASLFQDYFDEYGYKRRKKICYELMI